MLIKSAWDPLADLERLGEQVNRLFADAEGTPATDFPAMNLWIVDQEAIVTADLPGVTAAELEVTVSGKHLMISGARTPDPIKQGEAALRQERLFGAFRRSLALPFSVDAERVQSRLKDGVLTLRLPRAEAERPRKIAVQAS